MFNFPAVTFVLFVFSCHLKKKEAAYNISSVFLSSLFYEGGNTLSWLTMDGVTHPRPVAVRLCC